MIENYENKLISLPDDIEPPIKRITPQKKSNSEAQTQVTPEKPSPEASSGSEFLVSPESNVKKESSDDDKFLEPLPVKKAKVEKTQPETKMSSMYAPTIPNPMDLEVRKEFTPMVKFVDFNS